MAIKKQAARPAKETNPWLSTASPDELGPADRIAHDILAERRDLLPSVQRIMTAGLGAERTLQAIGLFRDSLSSPGDVHRDPQVAIARCTPAAERTSAAAGGG
jgi:hypothetical protein